MSSLQSKEQEQKDNEEYSKNFARIPNMLFVSYKHLTKEEKFLYCTLKSVYWDAKPRYVSLRELSELTNYSTGALSKMIPRLQTCGLVHYEIRREQDKQGREYGNAKFNITILDIWELNRQYFSCSPNERDLLDPSLKLVHENGQACSPNDTSSFTKSDKPVHEKRRVRAQPELTKESRKTPLKTNTRRSSASVQTGGEHTTTTTDTQELICFKNPEEQHIWTVGCQAQNLRGVTPNKTQREQIAEIERQFQSYQVPASTFSIQMLNEAWEDEKIRKHIANNEEWKLGNIKNAMPYKLAQIVKDQADAQAEKEPKEQRRTQGPEPMTELTKKEFGTRARDWGYTRGDEVVRALEIYEKAKSSDDEFYDYTVRASVGVSTMDEFFERLCELLGLEQLVAMED